MTQSDIISVIIPVYNVEKYIDKCLDSIINQTYSNLEIIVVDDGSTDKSGNICDKYAEKDCRINVIHKSNGGLSDARNVGIELANGEFICFIDSDDFIEVNMIEEMYNACIRNNVDMSICGRIIENNSESIVSLNIKEETVFDDFECLDRLLRWDGLDSAAWDKLYRKKLFEDIRYPVGKIHEDIPITAKLIVKSKNVVHVGKPLYHYVQRSNSITKLSFSHKRMYAIDHAENITQYIIEIYPQLISSCNYYLAFISYTMIFDILNSGNAMKFLNELRRLKLVFKNNYTFISDKSQSVFEDTKVFLITKLPLRLLIIIFYTKNAIKKRR